MTISFKNLIVGRHESRVLFMWNPKEGVAMLGSFPGIKTISRPSYPETETLFGGTLAVLEEFHSIAAENNWDFAALREDLS